MFLGLNMREGEKYTFSSTHNTVVMLQNICVPPTKSNNHDKPISLILVENEERKNVTTLSQQNPFSKISLTVFIDIINKKSDFSILSEGGDLDLVGLYEYEETEEPFTLFSNYNPKEKRSEKFKRLESAKPSSNHNDSKDEDNKSIDSAEGLYNESKDEEINLGDLLKQKRKLEKSGDPEVPRKLKPYKQPEPVIKKNKNKGKGNRY